MAFSLTKFEAMGVEVDEAVTRKFLQRSIMYIAGLVTDVDLDIGDYTGTFWTAVGGTEPGITALRSLKDIVTNSVAFNQVYGTGLIGKAVVDSASSSIVVLTSAASAGGAASEAVTVTGLATTDQIIAVSQKVAGANETALDAYGTQVTNGLTLQWTGDPGVGSRATISVVRAGAVAPVAGQYTLTIQNKLPDILFSSGDAPTSYVLILEHELQDEQLPVKVSISA